MPSLRVVAATYYDDRGVGGSEGVIVYFRNVGKERRESSEAPVASYWHALAHLASDGDCFSKFGPSIMDYPADEDPDEIYGSHDIAVHVRLAYPIRIDLPS